MISYLAISLIISFIATYVGGSLLHGNSDAYTIIITSYTVFAGFLVAIITILGDAVSSKEKGWVKLLHQTDVLEARLARHTYAFYIYLLIIGFLFSSSLTKGLEGEFGKYLNKILEHISFFLASFGFFITLALPRALSNIQRDRSESELGQVAPNTKSLSHRDDEFSN